MRLYEEPCREFSTDKTTERKCGKIFIANETLKKKKKLALFGIEEMSSGEWSQDSLERGQCIHESCQTITQHLSDHSHPQSLNPTSFRANSFTSCVQYESLLRPVGKGQRQEGKESI